MSFAEFESLKKLIEKKPDSAHFHVLNEVSVKEKQFPIIAVEIGAKDKSLPCFGLFAGVHGLERIGSQVVINYLEVLFEQMKWDEDLNEKLKHFRIVSIPIINPVGMALGRRSNGNGVDLMRNAPVPIEREQKVSFLVGGHRFGNWLPWYRGKIVDQMEAESQALTHYVQEQIFPSDFAMTLDVHSGFGLKDQLWFPFARSKENFPRLDLVDKFHNLLNHSHPNHVYKIEAQSNNYTTNGDLWDHIFDLHHNSFGNNKTFLPWTLEIGSWIWVRKNPLQLFSLLGLFNPIKEHRLRRTMRRHKTLLDLFLAAIKNHRTWQKIY